MPFPIYTFEYADTFYQIAEVPFQRGSGPLFSFHLNRLTCAGSRILNTAPSELKGLARLKLFWALSRTPHGLLDMTTPALAAGLWLGTFPGPGVALLGLLTIFAGYTAVYALNDVVDYQIDLKRIHRIPSDPTLPPDLDSAIYRHPIAQGYLGYYEGLIWALSWGAVAFIGAYVLNPVCAGIFILGCFLEAVYCLMLKVSPVRAVINGIVKTLGPVAAVFAVDPSPDAVFVLTLFATFFLWELGGQNIPNDCTDIKEDRRLGAQTFPVLYGLELSAYTILTTLPAAFLLTFVLFSISPAMFGPVSYGAVAVAGILLLLLPAFRFYRSNDPQHAMYLFNQASLYPAALFLIVAVRLFVSAMK